VLASLVVACAALAFATSAMASVTVTSFSLTPASLTANGHPNLTMSAAFSYPALAGDTVKDMTIGLAPGLLAAPATVPNCTPTQLTSNKCPANTEVATGTLKVTGFGLLGLTPTIAMYQMAPQASNELTRYGLYINAGITTLTQQMVATLRGTPTTGANLTATGLPKSAIVSIQINSISLTFNGTVNGTPYTRMPTSCAATSSFLNVDTYGSATVVAANSAFTPTGCSSLPFAPKGSLAVTPDTGDAGAAVALKVTQAATESASKSWTLTLPNNLAPNLKTLDSANVAGCTQASATAAPTGCPQVGTIAITTPLISSQLTGNVYLVHKANALPTLAIALSDPAGAIVINGTVGLAAGNKLIATIPALPDFPLTSIVTSFTGGPNSLLQASPQIGCTGAITGAYTAQDGSTATSTANITVSGTVPPCPTSSFPNGSTGSATKSGVTQGFQLSPSTVTASTTSAVSSPSLTANDKFTYPNTTDTIKTTVVGLGLGLLATPGGPTATCSPSQLTSNTCPAASQVGQGTVGVTTTGSGIAGAQTLPAGQYLMAPQSASEYARIGLVVSLGGTAVFTTQAPVTLDQTGHLTLSFSGLPNSVSILPTSPIAVATQITSFSLTFNGTVDGNAFLFAPNQCVSATTADATTTYAGTSVSSSSSYTPTGCPANADASNGGSVGTGGPLADGTASTFALIPSDTTISANPDLTSVLTFTYKDSNASVGGETNCANILAASATATCDALKSVSVALAPGELANAETIPAAQQCTASELSSNTCPATSQIGFGSTSALTYDTNQDGNSGSQNGLQTSVYVLPSSSPADLAELGLIVYFHGNPVATVSGNAQINESGQIVLTFNNLPTEAAIGTGSTVEVYTQVSKISLTFYGTTNQDGANGTALPFVTNPTGCTEEYSTATSTTYQDSTPVTATSAYVPTSATPGTPAGC
jgi:hypothetical protein